MVSHRENEEVNTNISSYSMALSKLNRALYKVKVFLFQYWPVTTWSSGYHQPAGDITSSSSTQRLQLQN